jgi:hypothetical protein
VTGLNPHAPQARRALALEHYAHRPGGCSRVGCLAPSPEGPCREHLPRFDREPVERCADVERFALERVPFAATDLHPGSAAEINRACDKVLKRMGKQSTAAERRATHTRVTSPGRGR